VEDCFVFLLPLLGASTFAATISDLVGQVSQSQYQTYQVAVESMGLGLYNGAYDQDFRSRDWVVASNAGDLGNQEAQLYLWDQFDAMGLNPVIQGTYDNVVGELPGTATPGDIYIVCGHFDHLAGSLGNERPGGDDNASGTAGVLEAARVLSQYSFDSTIRFIGFNAEEDGLLGSQNYVTTVVQAGGENVVGVINLDMILRPGSDVDPGGHPIDLQLATRTGVTGNAAWADIFRQTAGVYVPTLTVDPTTDNLTSGSDQDPFAAAGYPAFLAIENLSVSTHNDYYHDEEDSSDGLANDPTNPTGVTYDYAFAANTVAATVATIAQEAVLVPEPSSLLLAAMGLLALAFYGRRRTS